MFNSIVVMFIVKLNLKENSYLKSVNIIDKSHLCRDVQNSSCHVHLKTLINFTMFWTLVLSYLRKPWPNSRHFADCLLTGCSGMPAGQSKFTNPGLSRQTGCFYSGKHHRYSGSFINVRVALELLLHSNSGKQTSL